MGPGAAGGRRRLPVAVRVALEGAGVGFGTVVLVLLALVVADASAGRLPEGQMREAITGAPPVLAFLAVAYGLPTAVLVVAVGSVICVPVVALCPGATARPVVLATAVGTSVALVLAVVVLETPSDGPFTLLVGLVGGVLAAWRTRAVLASWVPRVAHLAAGGEKVRCAAGTRGVVHIDPVALLRGLVGRPWSDPLLDRRALQAGEPVAVSALRSVGRRARHGLLVLRPGPPGPPGPPGTLGLHGTWHPHRWFRGFGAADGDPLPVALPVDAPPVRWRRLGPRFEPVTLLVGGQTWQVAVPRPDGDLLRGVVAPSEQ